jgi:hypothetical protein
MRYTYRVSVFWHSVGRWLKFGAQSRLHGEQLAASVFVDPDCVYVMVSLESTGEVLSRRSR